MRKKKVAILGFAFKKNTNDCRESPAITICQELLSEGAAVAVYDPKVNADLIQKSVFKDLGFPPSQFDLKICRSLNEALDNADAVVLVTDWECFININWQELAPKVRRPTWVFDTRNCLNKVEIEKAGFNYWALGKP